MWESSKASYYPFASGFSLGHVCGTGDTVAEGKEVVLGWELVASERSPAPNCVGIKVLLRQ